MYYSFLQQTDDSFWERSQGSCLHKSSPTLTQQRWGPPFADSLTQQRRGPPFADSLTQQRWGPPFADSLTQQRRGPPFADSLTQQRWGPPFADSLWLDSNILLSNGYHWRQKESSLVCWRKPQYMAETSRYLSLVFGAKVEFHLNVKIIHHPHHKIWDLVHRMFTQTINRKQNGATDLRTNCKNVVDMKLDFPCV